jgi:hypothetical protein
MLKSFAIFAVIPIMAATPLPAAATGEPPETLANRVEDPRVLIKDILDSDRPNDLKRKALAPFVCLNDHEEGLAKRLGKPNVEHIYFCVGREHGMYSRLLCESGLVVTCFKEEVIVIGYYRGDRYVELAK